MTSIDVISLNEDNDPPQLVNVNYTKPLISFVDDLYKFNVSIFKILNLF